MYPDSIYIYIFFFFLALRSSLHRYCVFYLAPWTLQGLFSQSPTQVVIGRRPVLRCFLPRPKAAMEEFPADAALTTQMPAPTLKHVVWSVSLRYQNN